jgi:hypothetical protein
MSPLFIAEGGGRVVETGMFYKNSMAPHIVNILIPSIIASASKPTLIEL